uniref:DUF1778 domain-containing protein n=1 Tax=Heterorhabditis bacteriophora TaxID=37862 RepID=A0A1I7X739_HETBA
MINYRVIKPTKADISVAKHFKYEAKSEMTDMQKSNNIFSNTSVGPVAERMLRGWPEKRAKITPEIPPQRIASIVA